MSRLLKVAVVGATGAVGKQLLSILAERKFPVGELIPFASARSVGKKVSYEGREFAVRALEKGCFAGVDIAFFDASDAISKVWVPEASSAGAWVVDNSATFRLDNDVLLLVPEVNGHLLNARISRAKKGQALTPREKILTGPNCSTVQMVMALKPLRDLWTLKRVVVSTYQSASGAGAAAMDELTDQARGTFDGHHVPPKAFVHTIAFNAIPQIGGFKDDGYTSEEQKMMDESRKLLELPELRLSATAVRIPTYNCHGESINVEFEKDCDVTQARAALFKQEGVIVLDEPSKSIYPMNITSSGKDAVYVGRLRRDPSVKSGLNFWVVSDNLRKGAALNAVQIGEVLIAQEVFH